MSPRPRFREVTPIFREGDAVFVLDQLVLPRKEVYRKARTPGEIAGMIRGMVLRGAPLIGVAAAYGYAFGAKGARRAGKPVLAALRRHAKVLRASRPTAVNLFWAVSRMEAASSALAGSGARDFYAGLLAEADRILAEDVAANRRMADFGAALLKPGSTVITHCNAGALATAGVGTALGVVTRAHELGRIGRVFVDETRPYLQGSRLTLWELMRKKIPAELITDSMAAHIMKTERVDAVIVGSDRIAANADVANKIGTYGLSLLAREHGVKVIVVAPSTTVDLSIRDGSRIPIEERSAREVTEIAGRPIAPRGARARHPAFDVTPHALVAAIVTELGVVKPVNGRNLRKILAGRGK